MGEFINFTNKKRKVSLDNEITDYSKLNKIDYKHIYVKLVNTEYIPLLSQYIRKWGMETHFNKYHLRETIDFCNKLEYKNKIKYINDSIYFIKLLSLFMEESKEHKKIKQLLKKNNYLFDDIEDISQKLKKINNIRRKKEIKNNKDAIGYRIKRIYELYNILCNHNYLLRDKLDKCKDYDFFKIEEYWKKIEKNEFDFIY
jgi:hypothetical protein